MILKIAITLIIIGVLLYGVNRFIPMDDKIKQILNVVVILAVIVWLIYATGILSYLRF